MTTDDRSPERLAEPGQVLRQLRQAAGMSLAALAKRTQTDRSMISRVETGNRRLQQDLAQRCDRALGTAPLLQSLVRHDQGEDDDMKRRAMVWMFAAAAGVTAAAGRTALDEVLRAGMHAAVGKPDDWQPIIDDLQRRLVLDPSPEFGHALMAQLMMTRQALAEHRDPETTRAAATLSLLYGLWQGNAGAFPAAINWYRTSAMLALESGDTRTETYALGRSASRGIYEGMPARAVQDNAARALALTSEPTPGAVEARSAQVHLAGLRRDLAGGRQAVAAMRDLAEQLPASGPAGPHQRAVSFSAYLESRAGSFSDAQRAHEEAERELRGVPLWLADSRIYFALAMAREGDARGAVPFALEAIRTVPYDVHVLAMGVSDVLAALPADYRTEEAQLLRGYAAKTPGPWETLA